MIFLAILVMAGAGCQYSRNTSNYPTGYSTRPNFDPPPTDAYGLTGGKITNFIPAPGLPSSSTDKTLLQACQTLKLPGHTARSAYVVIQTGRFGKCPIHALVVGNQVLVLVGDLVTMGIQFSGERGELILYPMSAQSMTFTGGNKWSKVGTARIPLKHPVVSVNGGTELVMTLPDLLTVFKARDAQRGHDTHEIRSAKVVYTLPPMGQF